MAVTVVKLRPNTQRREKERAGGRCCARNRNCRCFFFPPRQWSKFLASCWTRSGGKSQQHTTPCEPRHCRSPCTSLHHACSTREPRRARRRALNPHSFSSNFNHRKSAQLSTGRREIQVPTRAVSMSPSPATNSPVERTWCTVWFCVTVWGNVETTGMSLPVTLDVSPGGTT